jgi:hypothetical protein
MKAKRLLKKVRKILGNIEYVNAECSNRDYGYKPQKIEIRYSLYVSKSQGDGGERFEGASFKGCYNKFLNSLKEG